MSALHPIQKARAVALEQAVELWKTEGDKARAAYDAAELVKEFLMLPRELEGAWQTLQERAVADMVDDLEEEGGFLRDLIDSCIGLLERGRGEIERFQSAAGRCVPRLDELPAAVAQVQALRSTFVKNWPWDSDPWLPLNEQRAEEGMAAVRRGEHLSVKELLEEELRRWGNTGG